MKLLGVVVVLKWNYMIKEYHCDVFVAMVFLVGDEYGAGEGNRTPTVSLGS